MLTIKIYKLNINKLSISINIFSVQISMQSMERKNIFPQKYIAKLA